MTNTEPAVYHAKLTSDRLVIKNRYEVIHTFDFIHDYAASVKSNYSPAYVDRLLAMLGFDRDTYWRPGNPNFGLSYSARLVRG